MELPDIESSANLIDSKIACNFLRGGKQLKDLVATEGGVQCVSADGKVSLVAVHKAEHHTELCTSLNRCVAIAAYYVLKHVNNGQDKLVNLNGCVEIDGLTMKNSLAEAHGIKCENNLYYVYNSGLEQMVEKVPKLTTAVLRWRTDHEEYLFKRKLTPLQRARGLKRYAYWYKGLVVTMGLRSVDQVLQRLCDDVDKDVVDYLANLKPYLAEDRRARDASKLRDWFCEMLKILQEKEAAGGR